jgi:hypothetical protein
LCVKNNHYSPLIGEVVANLNFSRVNSRRNYSTFKNKIDTNEFKPEINPWFITGFADAEGSFRCNMKKKSKYKADWEIQPVFQVKLHVDYYSVIVGIIQSLGYIGTVDIRHSTCNFSVRKLQDIIQLIEFFDKYPLISRKKGDYLLFKEIVSIIQLKEHLTTEGFQRIVNIKATLDFGLSKELQLMFPETIPVARPLSEPCVVPDTQWISGFTAGEGNFSVSLDKGIFKSLLFKITQHEKDEVLLIAIKDYLNCGNCYLRKIENTVDFKVTKFSDITEIIIPFFNNNPILGVKSLDFKDWCLVSDIVKKKEHKLDENVLRIKEIQKHMNRGIII